MKTSSSNISANDSSQSQKSLHANLEKMEVNLTFIDAFGPHITHVHKTPDGTPILWSTRDFETPPTPKELLNEVQSGKHEPHLIFGQIDTGGFNRPALTLFMSNANMTVIAQIPYGGAYANDKAVLAELRIFEKMNNAITAARANHSINPNEKLVFYHAITSGLETYQWAWVNIHDDHAYNIAKDWHTKDRLPLLNAAASIPGYKP